MILEQSIFTQNKGNSTEAVKAIPKFEAGKAIGAKHLNTIVAIANKQEFFLSKQIVRPPIGGDAEEGTIDDPIFEDYNKLCSDPLDSQMWARDDIYLNDDPDDPLKTQNPDHPTITPVKPIDGFMLEIGTRLCYDATTGELKQIFREFTYDSKGALKEMGKEQEIVIISFASCP